MFNTKGLREELTQDLKSRMVEHKNTFIQMFYGRYKELIPSLIVYENSDTTSINFLKVEVALRNGYDIVIGENVDGLLLILGYTNTKQSSENAKNLFIENPLTKDDIHFIVPENEIPKEMIEISHYDNCATGNFVVLKNKTLNYVNDDLILRHYTFELSELVLSRYSISMQAKINTFFTGEVNDETINQLVSDLYNGAPFVKTSALFDPKDSIHTVHNEHMASNFVELKREYQNKISELNNMLGVNSLAVEKASGVSDTEAKSNSAFTGSNANIYLSARNEPLDKLNRRYFLQIKAIYNDVVESEFSKISHSLEANDD